MPDRGAGAHQDHRAGETLGGKKLGEDRTHGMTEKHRLWRDLLEKALELGKVVRHAYADQGRGGIGGFRAVADEVGRVASPAQFLEHRLERVEAPGPFVSPVQHHDVPGHDFRPFARIPITTACRASRAGQR